MSYDPSDDYPDDGPVYDGFGAPITESTHQVEASGGSPQTLEQPGETWVRCTCGEEMESQDSAGGPALSIAELMRDHIDTAPTDPTPWLHESGTRHAHPRTAGPGVVHWMPRDDGADCGDSGEAA